MNEKTPIPPPDWEALIEVITKEIVEERTPARILQVRAKLYDLLTHCIPATTILKVPATTSFHQSRIWGSLTQLRQTLTFKLMPKIDDGLKADVVKWSAFYEHRIRMGSVCPTNALLYFALPPTNGSIESHLSSRSICGEVHAIVRRVRTHHSLLEASV